MKNISDDQLAEALKRCASEQIHFAGAIQAHGVLLAFDDAGIVRMASDNLEPLFGRSARESLERPISELVGESALAQLRAWLVQTDPGHAIPLSFSATVGGHNSELSAIAHRSGQLMVVELKTEAPAKMQAANAILSTVSASLWHSDHHTDVLGYCQYVAEELRRLTQFDRVKVYRFDSHWNGDVIAESRNDVLPSLLHHYFPASDIPPQARALYAKNLLRILADTEVATVPIIPALNPLTGQPLDLSYSTLRAISPIHIEYVRNMGVRSTITLSLMHEGKLWGMVACHNAEPRHITPYLREAIEFIGKTISLRLSALENSALLRAMDNVRQRLQQLTDMVRLASDFEPVFREFQSDYLSLAAASGSYVVFGDHREAIGEIPPPSELAALLDWVKQQELTDGVFVTDHLGDVYPPAQAFADTAAGLLAVALDNRGGSFIFWFRPEVIRNISWAGSPHGRVTTDASGPRIDPRRSFAVWLETARGYSEPWLSTTIDAVKLFSFSVVQLLMQQARQEAAIAAAASQAKSDFLSSVSHDLRTPMNAILGFGQLMKLDTSLSPENQDNVHQIVKAGDHLLRLINDVLDLAKVESGHVRLSLEPVVVSLAVSECLALIAPLAAKRALHLSQSGLEGVAVRADCTCLNQVLVNLLSNAIKYNREGGRVAVAIEDAGTQQLRLRVTDTGVGIASGRMKELFQPFSRLGAEKTSIEGTGIGLTITRHLVELMGGKMGVESEVGVGSTFWFELPRA